MKLSAVIATITAAYFAPVKQPIMLWGPPGVGKSQGVRQAAKLIGQRLKDPHFGFIDLRLSLLEPIDLRGFPMIEKGSVKWALPSFLPTSGNGVLFIDEVVQANPSMQAAASQLILDRRIGEYVLPEGWIVIAAGNRKSDRATTTAMPTHIANRFIHLAVEVNTDEWIAWALKSGIDIRVVAFIKWREKLLHRFDPQDKGEAFASPRSWEFASNMLASGIPDASLLEVMKGTVGEAAGTEFTGFLRVYEKMPDIDTILLNPAQAEVPTDLAVLHAVTSTLVHRADKDNLGRISKFFDRVKDCGRPEFAVVALKEIALKKPEVMKTRAYVEWASNMSALTA